MVVADDNKPSKTSSSIGISLSLSNSRLCSVTAASTPLGKPSGKCDSKKVCMKLSGSKPDPSPSRSKSSAVMKSGSSSPSGSFNLFDFLSPFLSPFFRLRCFCFDAGFVATITKSRIKMRNRTKMIPFIITHFMVS